MCYLTNKVLARILERLLRLRMLPTESQELLGIRVYFVDRRFMDPPAAFARVANALVLIRQTDPERFRRLKRYIRQIVLLRRSRTAGAFYPGTSMCSLETSFVRDYSSAQVALLLVHEATHARMCASGVSASPNLRHRIELRCISEEIAFGRRLPPDQFPEVNDWIAGRLRSEPTRPFDISDGG
jgi:hypothetical protein